MEKNKLNGKFITCFTSFVLRKKWWIFCGVITLTLFFSIFIGRLEINADVYSNLPENDKVSVLFNKIGEDFGSNYQAIIGMETDDIFKKESLQHIRQITDSLKGMPGIVSVTSLINILDIRGSEWGIEVTRLIDEFNLPESRKDLDSLKNYVLNKEFYKGALVSEDATMTIIVARISHDADNTKVAKKIKEKIMDLNLPEKIHFGGQPFIASAFGEVINKDVGVLGPLAVIFILFVLLISLRSAYGVILPIINVLISTVWTFGLMAITGIKVSIISSVIPILLVAIGSAYTIHLINRFRETRDADFTKSIKNALSFIALPVFYTAITDIFGFISFALGSYLDMISKFGLFTSFGILNAMILSLSFTPAVMSIFTEKLNRKARKFRDINSGIIDKFLERIVFLDYHYPLKVIVFWLLFALLVSIGIFRIERNVDIMSYLGDKNPNSITEKVLQEKMGGTSPVYILLKSDNVLSPEILQLADIIEQKMLSFKEVVHTQSLTSLFKQMNEVMGEGYRLPDNQAKTDNLWFLLEGNEFIERNINFEHTEMVIYATFASNDMEIMKNFTSEMESFLNQISTKKVQAEITGFPSLMISLDKNIVKSQFFSLLLAFLLILISVSVLSGSIIRGIIALTPILLTLTVLFGLMGLFHIPLDFATVLVGSICIGIGIDYAIHIVNHFKICMQEKKTLEETISEVIHISGKAISINVCSITAGFLILIFSSLIPLQRFGILLSVTMIISGLASISFLTSVLVLKNRKSGKGIESEKSDVQTENNFFRKVLSSKLKTLKKK